MRKYLICCVPHGAYAFSSLWTQGAEFEEQLDPMRKYLICCVPHGAYAFSSLWMRHNSDFNCTWKTSNIK
jgi:hypothetical protein